MIQAQKKKKIRLREVQEGAEEEREEWREEKYTWIY